MIQDATNPIAPKVHHRIRNFMVAYILMGHFALSSFIVLISTQERPFLMFNAIYALGIGIAVTIIFISRRKRTYTGYSLLLMSLLLVLITVNNPYTTEGIEGIMNFFLLTFLPCVLLCLCDISRDDLKQIFAYSALFSILLLLVLFLGYAGVGRLNLHGGSKDFLDFYGITTARQLVFAAFMFYYMWRYGTSEVLIKYTAGALLLLVFGIMLLIGKRQAILAILLSPLLMRLLSPTRIKGALIAMVVLAGVFYGAFFYIMPHMLDEGPLKKTALGKYLHGQYYSKKQLLTMSGRTYAYQSATEVISQNLWGVGFTNYGRYMMERYNLRFDNNNPHNMWLTIAAELGLPGSIVAAFLFFYFLRLIISNSRTVYQTKMAGEAEVLCMISISVLLFSLVGIVLQYKSFIFFVMPVLMEKVSYHFKAEYRSAQ